MKIKTFVINLKRRKDRRERMRRIIPSILDVEFTSDLRMDVDGNNLTEDQLSKLGLFQWKINSDNSWWNRPLKKGEIGCSLSHLNCWRHIVKTNSDTSLILEDDIILSDGFTTKLESVLDTLNNHDPNWELLYLGREPLQSDEYACDGIVKPGYSFGTFAYMITRDGAQKLIDTDFEHSLIPSDEFLPAMYIPHPRSDVNKKFQPSLNAYAIEPSLIFPLPEEEANGDTENSDFIT